LNFDNGAIVEENIEFACIMAKVSLFTMQIASGTRSKAASIAMLGSANVGKIFRVI
jgi:hypothetical protein